MGLTFMTDLALEPNMSGTIRLYDLNENAAKANETIGNHVTEREEAVGKWKYETYTDAEQALTGVDFIVISILPGTLRRWLLMYICRSVWEFINL